MGKKIKEEHKHDFNFKGGDNFQRMDYLFKLGDMIYNKSPHLSKFYISAMKDIAKRNTLKIDKKFKRLLCSKCNNLLYKDKDSTQLLEKKSGKHVLKITCSKCKEITEMILF